MGPTLRAAIARCLAGRVGAPPVARVRWGVPPHLPGTSLGGGESDTLRPLRVHPGGAALAP